MKDKENLPKISLLSNCVYEYLDTSTFPNKFLFGYLAFCIRSDSRGDLPLH